MAVFVYIAVFIANVAAFLAGSALTWTSPVNLKLTDPDETPLDHLQTQGDEEQSWIGSLVPLGAILGPLTFSFLSDKIGRKYAITSLGLPFVVSFLILAFANKVVLYYIARFLAGIAVGGVFTIVPIYIGEVSPDNIRGFLSASMVSFVTFGQLFSYSVGPYTSVLVFSMILAVLPVCFMVGFFLVCPESPYYLIRQNKKQLATAALSKLRGTNVNSVDSEINEIERSLNNEQEISVIEALKSKGNVKAVLIGVFLLLFQQFSGINAVLFNAQDIFKGTGSVIPPEVSTIIIGSVQFLTCCLIPLISDKLGRKFLLIISSVGMFISLVPLGLYFFLQSEKRDVSSISWLPVLCLVLYIVTYNVGFGPLPWGIMGEIFPSNCKSMLFSIAAMACWFVAFLITKFFSSVSSSMGQGASFWLFSGCCFFAVLFCKFYVFETKGKSLQEIQKILNS